MSLVQRGFLPYDGSHAPKEPFVLNKASPQARGLVFWCPAVRGAVLLHDFVSGTTTASLETPAVNRFGGLAYDSENAGSQLQWPVDVPDTGSLTALTLSLWAITTNVGGNKTVAVKTSDATFQIRDNQSNYKGRVGGCTEIVASSPASRDGIERHHVLRMAGANVEYWIDGTSVGTASDAVALQSSGGAGTNIGDSLEGLKWWDYRIYDRALTDAEVFALWDPATRYDLIHIVGRRTYFFVAPAVGGFVPYPNPRYALTGGMQPMSGGV